MALFLLAGKTGEEIFSAALESRAGK